MLRLSGLCEAKKVVSYLGTWKSLCKSSIDDDTLEDSSPVESMLFLKDDNSFFLNIENTDYQGMLTPYSGSLGGDSYFDGLLLYSDDVLFLCKMGSFDSGDKYLIIMGIDGATLEFLDTVYYYTRD